MGQVSLCNQCIDLQDTSLKLKESACVQFIDNLPHLKGKFNFQKQATFNKIQKAASDYCTNNNIEKTHMAIIARLLAYQQNHYFEVIKQLPIPLREKFITNQENIDIELMDSLYHYFLVKQNRKNNPQLIVGPVHVKAPPTIDITQIEKENLVSLSNQGLNLLRTGKVALVIMMAGNSQNTTKTSKGLTPLPLIDQPTALELLLKRYIKYTRSQDSPKQKSKKKNPITPIIVICCEKNLVTVNEIFYRNDYFGLQQKYIKILKEEKTVPLINPHGKLCISFEQKTVCYPAGTALAVPKILQPKIKSFLECCLVEYVHFIGCENIAELPGDPLLLGLTHKLKRKIAGKCIAPTSKYQKYPRYVASKSAYHLLDIQQLNVLGDPHLMMDSPLALNSLIFRLDSLIDFYNNFQTNLYIAKRFHMYEVNTNYYDFQERKPVSNAKVYNFEQDIRDYISASTQTIVVKYRQQHFRPILSTDQIQSLCEKYKSPPLY